MDDPYRRLASDLAGDGISCQFQTRGRLVVSRQARPVWPDEGNSFWVTRTCGRWYLFTWSPIGYIVPESADMVALCQMCMAHGKSAMPAVPATIIEAFGLVELSDDDADAVIRENDEGA